MKKWSICIMALLVSACASDETIVPGALILPQQPGDLSIRISFPESSSATRALTVDDEKKIESLKIFVFTDAGAPGISRDDKYVYMIDVHQDSIRGNATARTVNVAIKKLLPGDPIQRFVLVANMHNTPGISLNLTEDVSTEEDLIEQLRFSATARWGTTLAENDPAKFFPMWGTSIFYDANGLLTASPILVDMTRALAGIEVGVDINNPEAGDPAIGFGSVFVIDSVYICNVNDSAYIAPADWKKHINTKKADIGYKFPSNGLRLERSIYVPGTDSLIIVSGDTTHLPPFLVLKARYYNGTPYYYRIDFTRNNEYIPLLRSNKYVINITGIRSTGYETFAEARNAPVLPLNPNLVLDGTDPVTKNINDIIYLDKYWLGSEATDVKMDWNTQGAVIRVATSYPGGWTAKLTATSPDFSCSANSNLNTVTVSPISFNTTGLARTVTVELSAGTLRQYINVTQSPGSNTYVVRKGDVVTIHKSSANIDGVNRAGYITSANQRSINSSNNINLLTVDNGGYITFMAPNQPDIITVTAGNGGGNTLWAWTVWVVDDINYFEDPAGQRHYNGHTFMDRDLANGLRYQWGRKDPVVLPAGLTIAPAPANMNEQEAVKNPFTFYTSQASPFDWMTAGQNNNLWTTIDGEKGPYDPCPFGWRVPPAENNEASPWTGFTNGKNGMNIDNTGGLSGSDGTTPLAGRLIWGASARGTEAYLYDAASGSHKSARRSAAYPVRCMRDAKYPGGSLIVNTGI
ncbi:MAG: hypothetical protein LBK65_01715 [Tannerellaceae bacterium]|jgi:hypothetical protein|nr:hypothetical protein [Tannerellaceae bacterium]